MLNTQINEGHLQNLQAKVNELENEINQIKSIIKKQQDKPSQGFERIMQNRNDVKNQQFTNKMFNLFSNSIKERMPSSFGKLF